MGDVDATRDLVSAAKSPAPTRRSAHSPRSCDVKPRASKRIEQLFVSQSSALLLAPVRLFEPQSANPASDPACAAARASESPRSARPGPGRTAPARAGYRNRTRAEAAPTYPG